MYHTENHRTEPEESSIISVCHTACSEICILKCLIYPCCMDNTLGMCSILFIQMDKKNKQKNNTIPL